MDGLTASALALYSKRRLQTPKLYRDYYDAFSSECRVYGRLKEETREDLAARAFGYLLLTADQEAEITQRTIEDGWEYGKEEIWTRSKDDQGQPVRAIVKELVEEDEGFQPQQLPKMWKDLQAFHTIGILVVDIHERNYVGGKLVDFRGAFTMFHPYFEHPQQNNPVGGDAKRFKSMVMLTDYRGGKHDGDDEQGEYELDWLREFGRMLNDAGEFIGIDPSDYDWGKWEEDDAAADDFIAWDLYEDQLPQA